MEVVAAIQLRTPRLVSPARRRADQLPFCAAVAYAAHPLLGHGALFFPVVAKLGAERYGGVANSLSGPPSPGQLALPAALGTRWSPCRRPSRDAQTEDLRSPTSTGLGRGVAAPFARRRPNRECALTRWEPADNKSLIPQRPHAHGRAPLPGREIGKTREQSWPTRATVLPLQRLRSRHQPGRMKKPRC